MIKLPQVFQSGALIAKVGDIDVYLLTVEFWGEHVVVRLVAASTDATRTEVAAQEGAMEAWAQRRNAGADEPWPSTSGERIAESVQVRVDDDAGTQYWLSVRTGGGSGTELLSEWVFGPALPSNASTVSVTVTSTDGGTQVARFNT